MSDQEQLKDTGPIRFKVIYSARRTLGISVLHDGSVIVRAPYRTTDKTIYRLVTEKSAWILKHASNFRNGSQNKSKLYIEGESHLFRGNECVLRIKEAGKPSCNFYDGTIEVGVPDPSSASGIKTTLYKGYGNVAGKVFPEILNSVLEKHREQNFRPAGLTIRTMKRRWGSCTGKGKITLNTELIKLHDIYIEYVIVHELCHLRHHNHGSGFYSLLSDLFPEWKKVRNELRNNILI